MPPSSRDSNLSPRQQFQNSVRQLSSEDIHRHKRNKSISLKYNPYELQHVASLRVSPVRSSPRLPASKTLRQVIEEPNFGSQERDVWSNKSPSHKTHDTPSSSFSFYEDSTASPTRSSRRVNDAPLLVRPQIFVEADYDERPKTRHGPSGPSAFEPESAGGDKAENDADIDSIRNAKFVEGTMTSRSGPVSSTWNDYDSATSSSEAEETESEITPKADRKRQSDSFDLRDFQPPPLTSSAIKRTLFGKRTVRKSKNVTTKGDDVDGNKDEKPKKRLRKSMSKLQFLGEKMKMFGSSSQDLPEQSKAASRTDVEDEKAILDERKRKAEAAYAEQFGLKKQRDSDGSATVTKAPEKHQHPDFRGNQKCDSSTVRRRSTTKSRRISTGSILVDDGTSQTTHINEHDFRKRPSRRELEKENQQLRALLRESQAASETAVGSALELDTLPPVPPVPPLRIRKNSITDTSNRLSLDASLVASSDPVEPPVPPLPPQNPNRRVLGNVSNNRSRNTRRESFGITTDSTAKEQDQTTRCPNPLQNTPKLVPSASDVDLVTPRRSLSVLPRSVSSIREEPEDEIDERKRSLRSRTAAVGKENTVSIVNATGDGTKKEEWQWPDDVF